MSFDNVAWPRSKENGYHPSKISMRYSSDNQGVPPSWVQDYSGIPEYTVLDHCNIDLNYNDASGNKRKRSDFLHAIDFRGDGGIIDAVIKNECKSKRFVWPDFLHNEFVAAVFDVGLRFANSEPLPGIQFHQYQDAQLAEFLTYRLRKIQNFRGIIGAAGKNVNPSKIKEKGHHSKKKEIVRSKVAEQARLEQATLEAEIAKVRSRMAQVRDDLEKMSNAINIQMTHLMSLKSSFDRQINIHSDLQTMLNSVEQLLCQVDSNIEYGQERDRYHVRSFDSIFHGQPCVGASLTSVPAAYLNTQSSSLPPHNLPSSDDRSDEVVRYLQRQLQGESWSELSSSRQPHLLDQSAFLAGRNVSINSRPNIRDELPLISEMRAHMDMHRQLLMRRDDQLAMHQHSSSSATGKRSQRASSDGGPDKGTCIGNHLVGDKAHHHHRDADQQGEADDRPHAGGDDKDGCGTRYDSGYAAGSVWTDDDGNGDLDENLFAFLLDS